MTFQDLNTGNDLIRRIQNIDVILTQYDSLHGQGLQAVDVTFGYGDYGSFSFHDPEHQVVDALAATFITNLTNYRNQLQQQFDQLGTGGGAD